MEYSKLSTRPYGRLYRKARKYASNREVLISTYLILSLFTVSFFAAVFIRPTAITIASLWREIQDKKTVHSQLEKKISDLEKAQSLYTSIKDDLIYLDRALPEEAELSRFLKKVEYLASTHGLNYSSGSFPGLEFYTSELATPSAAKLDEYPFSISLKGSFSQFRAFLADLENLDRMAIVHLINISPVKDKKGEEVYTLVLFLSSSVYSFPEVSEQ
jgi:Tfp pilus assembly protein PilO